MKSTKLIDTAAKKVKALLVGIEIKDHHQFLSTDDSLVELELLANTAGLEVIATEKQKLEAPNPSTYIGKGKVEEIKVLSESLKADMVVFDEELSPRHFKELEKEFGEHIRVIDRTTLILDIFAQHAQTREGQLQVELAQYEYFLPRLTRAWTHLARQAGGGAGRSGGVGGVGLRGPGETQLEVDRRIIRNKISTLKKDIEKVREHRNRYRQNRKRSQIPVVALVGYTNAGKSTLINSLTNSDVYVADKLFATLDPTTRRLELPGGHAILISDTVGFIQKLPTHLIAAFRATLEEISEADLLIHVVDISHIDAIAQWRSVMATLKEIDAVDIPMITVLNKADRLMSDDSHHKEIPEFQDALLISAKTGENLANLLSLVMNELFETFIPLEVSLPYKYGNLISRFHQLGKVDKIEHGVGEVIISGSIPGRLLADFERFKSRRKK
ncbi:MAG: GTPase HflX [Pelolinea sp.]|nr:GTPase HflX [Pelolinea sp.]